MITQRLLHKGEIPIGVRNQQKQLNSSDRDYNVIIINSRNKNENALVDVHSSFDDQELTDAVSERDKNLKITGQGLNLNKVSML